MWDFFQKMMSVGTPVVVSAAVILALAGVGGVLYFFRPRKKPQVALVHHLTPEEVREFSAYLAGYFGLRAKMRGISDPVAEGHLVRSILAQGELGPDRLLDAIANNAITQGKIPPVLDVGTQYYNRVVLATAAVLQHAVEHGLPAKAAAVILK